MGKKIDKLLTIIIVAVLLPLFVTIVLQRMRLEQVIYGTLGESVAGTEAVDAPAFSEVEVREIEEQVLGIVAKEINVGEEREAILAQCIIARTNLYDARTRGTAEPEALSITELEVLWGDNFEKNYRSLREYVAKTENQVLTWNDDYIYAAYHAISAGRTRDMEEMYEEAQMPYLTKRLCQEDTSAEGFLDVRFFDMEEFLEGCRERFPETTLSEYSEIAILDRDETGYVKEIQLGSGTYPGEEFRSRWGLNSACFTVSEVDGKVRVVTKGLGHGFGLSQHMAAHMASEGQTCEEILNYFYPGTVIKEAPLSK